MKEFRSLIFFILMILIISGCSDSGDKPESLAPWYPAFNENGDPVFGVFESRIPCADCQTIKFGLALYWDQETKEATTYQMSRVHVGKGNERTVNEGIWTITQGKVLNSQAVLYLLDSNAPQEFMTYWAIGHDILFILDEDMNPRIGDAGYGYALNRINRAGDGK